VIQWFEKVWEWTGA